ESARLGGVAAGGGQVESAPEECAGAREHHGAHARRRAHPVERSAEGGEEGLVERVGRRAIEREEAGAAPVSGCPDGGHRWPYSHGRRRFDASTSIRSRTSASTGSRSAAGRWARSGATWRVTWRWAAVRSRSASASTSHAR